MLTKPALAYGGRLFVYRDLVEAGSVSGRWQRLEAEAAEGLRRESSGLAVDDSALRAAATEFRYARRLLAAEELRRWLAERSIESGEWYAFLRRRLLRGQPADVDAAPPAPAGVEAILWVEAICSGTMRSIANDLIGWCAAADALGVGSADASIPELRAAHERLVAATVTDEAVGAVLREHAIDWMHVEYETLVLPTRGAAREARLCIRDDGQSMTALASRLELESESAGVYLDSADESLAGALLAADAGAVVGPMEEQGGWRLLRVVGKQQPRPEDQRLRRRAEALLMESEVGRHSAGRVEWHGAF